MEDQASFDFVVMRERGPLDGLRLLRTRRLAGRVLACLYNPGILKKVPEEPRKVTKITVEK